MKKRGFTLAEVLIAMALVGVIASMTIPTLVSSNRNKSNAIKLSSVVSDIENALTTAIALEAAPDLTETTINTSFKNLTKYLKISETDKDNTYIAKNGALLEYKPKSIIIDETKAVSYGCSVDGSIGYLDIDVTGDSGPNLAGRDKFNFHIGNDGILYPAGGLNYSVLEKGNDSLLYKNSGDYYCENGSLSIGCTARLIENNYEIDY